MRRLSPVQLVLFVVVLTILGGGVCAAQEADIRGTVVDPLGARVAGATVTLLDGPRTVGTTTSSREGEFAFPRVAPGRYQIEVTAPGFQKRTTEEMFVGGGSRQSVEVALPIGPLEQDVTVTGAASEVLPSQIGAPITVIDQQTLEALGKVDVLEALRLVPGSQVVQTGARGGITSMFIRGGNSSFNKVLVDGVAVNDIGGATDVAPLSTTGVERIEILRESNSVLFGSDALNGVINITTRRGRTRIPEASFTIDGGNLATHREGGSIGGAVQRFDYFGEFSNFQTDNSVPNNKYRNRTFVGRFGVAIGNGSDLSGTVRWIDGRYETPNGIDLFGIPDDTVGTNTTVLAGATLQSQLNDRWQTTVRFGSLNFRQKYDNPTLSGEPYDPFGSGAVYVGKVVTLHGANGYSTTGQAILDYGPYIFESKSTRRSIVGSTTFQLFPELSVSGGGRYDREEGFSDPTKPPSTTRDNGGVFVEGRGTVVHRVGITAGVGYEHNAVFKSATSPRVSLAVFLRNPTSAEAFGDTKLVFNAGKGIKAPGTSQADSSLYAVLQQTPAGSALAAAAGLAPIGPERSRTIDVGIEQGLAGGRARVRAAYFDNEFSDLIEFVSNNVLPQLGISPAAAAATGFGAYVNTQSYNAKGIETSVDVLWAQRLRVAASYTHLVAEVTKSLSDGVLNPSVNPAFPDVQIGVYAPLVGQRPFHRPPNVGTLLVSYTEGPYVVALAGHFAGKSDGSTFQGFSDKDFGNSMLLPNRDLIDVYQKIDLSGSYRLHRMLRAYVSVENVLDKRYTPSFGFPALPVTARAGVTITVGGDRK